jgi:peptidoglycan/xylan/chitin deacetylase (PgdA/CDA1 family)
LLQQAPARSTRDDQPRDATRGRRTPPASPAKLRLTRRAWLLLWLTVAGLVLVDGRLLIERSRILVAVEGHSLPVPAGLTVQQALRRLAVPPSAGDLLAVDHTVLCRGAYPPRVLVNGQPAAGIRRLRRGDRVTVEADRDRMEPVFRGLQQLPARRPGNPVRWLSTGPAQAVLNRGSLSGRVVPVGFHPAGGSPPAPLPVALTFDDGPWPHATEQILAILAQRQAPATFFVVGRQVQRYPDLVRRELAAGMAIGSHSYHHPQSFDRLAAARIRDEIVRGRCTLDALGVRPVGFRPPGGAASQAVVTAAQGSATPPCCGVSTRPTGDLASRLIGSSSACWPRPGQARSCCCTTAGGTARPPWRPCQRSSMGYAAWV